MSFMKIIQANKFYFMQGGAERYVLDVSAWLEFHGHEVIPFAMDHPDNLETPYQKYFPSFVQTDRVAMNWQGIRTLSRMVYSLEARRKMATLIAQTKPDIAHLHNIYTQLSPSILHTLRDQHVPVVMTVHDHHLISAQYNIWAHGCGEDYRNVGVVRGTLSRFHKDSFVASFSQTAMYKFHRWLKIYERGIDLFMCPSQYMKRQLVRGGFQQEKIRVNPFGIDHHAVTPRYDHDGYFFYAGRLSEEKGIETIIRAAKIIGDVKVKIAGRGPEMDRLHHLAHDVPGVEFLGFRSREEVMELYRGAIAVLLPSRVHENFPLMVLEALASGKPVIASDVGGVGEMIDDRVNGFLLAPTDLFGWVEAMMRLSIDDRLQQSMSRAARATIEHRFKLEDHYRRLMCMYQEIL